MGQTITPDGKDESKIKTKIAIAKNMFQQMYRLLTSRKKMKTEDVLKNLKTEKTCRNALKARKLKFFGHTKRHESIMKNILEGKMECRRPRGRLPAQ